VLKEKERWGREEQVIPRFARRQHQVSLRQTWRYETVTVRGKSQVRYRDLQTGRFIKKP